MKMIVCLPYATLWFISVDGEICECSPVASQMIGRYYKDVENFYLAKNARISYAKSIGRGSKARRGRPRPWWSRPLDVLSHKN